MKYKKPDSAFLFFYVQCFRKDNKVLKFKASNDRFEHIWLSDRGRNVDV